MEMQDIVDIIHEVVELAVSRLGIKVGKILCNDHDGGTIIYVGEVDQKVVEKDSDTVELVSKPRKGIAILLDKKLDCSKIREELSKLMQVEP